MLWDCARDDGVTAAKLYQAAIKSYGSADCLRTAASSARLGQLALDHRPPDLAAAERFLDQASRACSPEEPGGAHTAGWQVCPTGPDRSIPESRSTERCACLARAEAPDGGAAVKRGVVHDYPAELVGNLDLLRANILRHKGKGHLAAARACYDSAQQELAKVREDGLGGAIVALERAAIEERGETRRKGPCAILAGLGASGWFNHYRCRQAVRRK
jgi:hypothetical protein